MSYNKYYKQKKQVSYDEGVTWQDVTPAEYQKGALYEKDSPDCSLPIYRWTNMDISADWVCDYIEPTGTKFQATYSDGSTYSKECDDNTTLATGDTRPTGYERSAMTEAIIGDCVRTIGNNAFAYFFKLNSVVIPNSVTIIESLAFADCHNLTMVNSNIQGECNIPAGVTFIDDDAFWSCSGFTSINIPDSIITIRGGAFKYCSSLTSVTINATTPPTLTGNPFDDTNNYPIYVPASSVNAYKTTYCWSKYASRIQPIA